MNTSVSNCVSELERQLALVNKAIFEAAIIENGGRVKMNTTINAVDNLEVDGIQNQKYIDRIISVDAMIEFHKNGGIITKCKPRKIKQSEKTWVSNRGSIYNMGSKAAKLAGSGINVRKG